MNDVEFIFHSILKPDASTNPFLGSHFKLRPSLVGAISKGSSCASNNVHRCVCSQIARPSKSRSGLMQNPPVNGCPNICFGRRSFIQKCAHSQRQFLRSSRPADNQRGCSLSRSGCISSSIGSKSSLKLVCQHSAEPQCAHKMLSPYMCVRA